MGSYSSTLVASAKLRLTLRGPRFRGRYYRSAGVAVDTGKDGSGFERILSVSVVLA